MLFYSNFRLNPFKSLEFTPLPSITLHLPSDVLSVLLKLYSEKAFGVIANRYCC